jgi:hypothetical protein
MPNHFPKKLGVALLQFAERHARLHCRGGRGRTDVFFLPGRFGDFLGNFSQNLLIINSRNSFHVLKEIN